MTSLKVLFTMSEVVHIEVHLAVCAHPVMVDSKQCQLGQDVIYGSDSDVSRPVLADFFGDHVCRCVTKGEHGFMYSDSLTCSFQVVFLQKLFEFF